MDIKEVFDNLAHATAEDRAAVTNPSAAIKHKENQVGKQTNDMATKYAAIETMQELIQELQGDIKTLTTRKSYQITKKTRFLG